MKDSQRQAMYDGWARGKKWARVEVEKLDEGRTATSVHGHTWKACAVDAPFGCVFRQSKLAAIQRIESLLAERGYEISNLAELLGIESNKKVNQLLKEDKERFEEVKKHWLPKQEERRTFLEWLQTTKKTEYFHWEHGIPEHKLKDPSKFGTEPEYPSRAKRRALNDITYNK